MTCIANNCKSSVLARSMCNRHYLQMKNHGHFIPTSYENRSARIKGNYAYLPLGLNSKDGEVKVDKEFAWLDKYKWSIKDGGACSRIDGKLRMIETLVIDRGNAEVIDHINRNRLDNTRVNLRTCNRHQNRLNSSNDRNSAVPYKGVWTPTYNGKYKAQAMYNGIKYYLGIFDTAIEAAKAYDQKALELHGDYAALNFEQLKEIN